MIGFSGSCERSRVAREFVHVSDEAVAPTGQGLNEARIFRRIAQRLANLVNGRAEAVLKINERLGIPKFLPQLFARNHLAGLLNQRDKNLEGLLLEFDFDPDLRS